MYNKKAKRTASEREREEEREGAKGEKDRLISRCFPAGIVVIIIQCNRRAERERERGRENAQLDLLQLRI